MSDSHHIIELVIDNREHKLITALNKLELKNISLKVECLKIGDVIIRVSSDNMDMDISTTDTNPDTPPTESNIEQPPIFIFERKTCSDLLSSINDGRYREQKARLISNFPKNRIAYIIEGDINSNLDRYKKNGKRSVIGAITNCLFRDNIKILRTDCLDETVVFLVNLCKKCVDKPKLFIDSKSTGTDKLKDTASHEHTNYIENIKIDKKNNITPEVYGILSISLIPGISKKMARCIIEKYGCFMELVSKIRLENNDDDIQKELSSIDISINGGKTRKLGPKISKRIIEYLDN